MKKIVTLLFLLSSIILQAAVIEGENGPDCHWTLDTETGVFTLSGTALRWKSDSTNSLPWYDHLAEIETLVVDSSVTYLGSWGFAGAENLKEVFLPDSICHVGAGVFYNCPRIASPIYSDSVFIYMPTASEGAYSLPSGPKRIADGAFYGCNRLSVIRVPDSYIELGNYTFYHCSSLVNIIVRGPIEEIGNSTFEECGNLRSFHFENVKKIGDQAFLGCTSLTTVDLPENFVRIGKKAFELCSELTTLRCPASIEYIGEQAFRYCDGIKTVNIPNESCKIGKGAFPMTTVITHKHAKKRQ